jgi:hypothetical protein
MRVLRRCPIDRRSCGTCPKKLADVSNTSGVGDNLSINFIEISGNLKLDQSRGHKR